jgi:hypothetical protein
MHVKFEVNQVCTNAGQQFAVVTKFCTLEPNICSPQSGTFIMSPSGG